VSALPPLLAVRTPATVEDVDALSLYNVLRTYRFADVGSLPVPVLDRLRERLREAKTTTPLAYSAASKVIGWVP
jgi:hypothetical protein